MFQEFSHRPETCSGSRTNPKPIMHEREAISFHRNSHYEYTHGKVVLADTTVLVSVEFGARKSESSGPRGDGEINQILVKMEKQTIP